MSEQNESKSIRESLDTIRYGVKGEDIQGALADGLEIAYDHASIDKNNANMEVKMARGTARTLGDRLNGLNSQVEGTAENLLSKRNINNPITLKDLHTDVKSAITGGSVAVVGLNAVGEENIKRGSVNEEKLSFTPVKGSASKNLFDKDAITEYGTYISANNGRIYTGGDSNITTSDWMPVESGVKYTIKRHYTLVWYDAEKEFISGVGTSAPEGLGNAITVTSPTLAQYLRISTDKKFLINQQVEVGETSTPYTKYGDQELSKNVRVKNDNIVDGSIFPTKINGGRNISFLEPSKNLYNKNTNKKGLYIASEAGVERANDSYFASDYIPISGNTSYALKYFDQLAFYNQDKVYLSGLGYSDGTMGSALVFNSPIDARFIRISIQTINLDRQQLEKGEESTEFVEHASYLPLSAFDPITRENITNINNFPSYKSIHQIMSKLMSKPNLKIKLIGDSITHGYGGTDFKQDGELIYSGFKVNENGYCWANLLKAHLEEKFDCVVKNFGTTGSSSSRILSNLSSLVRSDDDIIICMIGTNNRSSALSNPLNKFYNDLIAIGNYVKGQGKEIIFMSSIPASVYNETEEDVRYFHMEDVDTAVMSASAHFNTEYISVYKQFLNYCEVNNVEIDTLLKDGLHPNDDGYLVMFDIICDSLGIGRKRPDATW